VLIFVYGVSGLLAGLGGAMQAARLYAANGLQLGQSYELDAITAVILVAPPSSAVSARSGERCRALIIAVLSNGPHPHRCFGRMAICDQGSSDHRRRGARPLSAAGLGPH